MKIYTFCSLVFLAGTTLATAQTDFFRKLKKEDVASNPSIQWTQFGPGMSGNNKSAFWHPLDPNVLFISPNMGNSYRTTDKGLTYETVLDEDGSSIKMGTRGPDEFNSIDFSRQNPNFGFSTDSRPLGLFMTTNKGKTWVKNEELVKVFGKSRLSCITVNPKDENVWYVGAGAMREWGRILFSKAEPHGTYIDANSQGKIWKSTTKGKTWELINSGLHEKAEIETIIVDPVDTNIIYANSNYGFYKSTDAGKHWELKINGIDTDVIRSFTMHHDKQTNKVTLFVIASVLWEADGKTIKDAAGGIFKSTDKGENWTKINGDLAVDMNQFASDKSIIKSYYNVVGYFFGVSIAKAQAMFPELPQSLTFRFNELTVDPNNANNLYLVNMYSNASRNNFIPGCLWRSKDGGKHWFVTFRNGKNWNQGKDVNYWKQRNNPMGTNVSLLYLHDWINRDTYDRKACNFARFNADGTVLHTQLAKISLMSYDKGDTWVDIDDVKTASSDESYIGAGNSNLPGHGFYQDLRFPGKVFCAAGENSLWVTNDDISKERPNRQSATYHDLLESESSLSCYAIHPKNPLIHFALFFRQDKRGKLMKSIDGGKTWKEQGTPIPAWEVKAHSGDQSVHQLSLIIDPVQPDNMYFCVPKTAKNMEFVGDSETGFGVHKSTDGGFTWSEINNGLAPSRDVSMLKFDPNNPAVLYATVQGNKGELYKSTNRGEQWEEVESTSDIKGKFGINDIHFAPDGKVYITSGYKNAAADDGGLWVSDQKMKSWKKIFDYPWCNRVEVAQYDSKVILLSTLANTNVEGRNAGVYLSKDGGATWIKMNKGNGQSDRVNDIAIDYFTPGKYYASTYGSGFYVAKE
ncbi:sialidase family protein [Flavobacterium algicola]|uniref:sialidase family protein n=1 Tax=Flavobacterium algicola TaxID=556529 RepID=UPI001EFD440E|nr:sialidase family protein [Flavobacterium algicola]MCG9793685.1 hypothetical protein [Flavobacterium algicola]